MNLPEEKPKRGVSWRSWAVLATLIAIVVAVALPQYGDYAARARVADGLAFAAPYRTAISEITVQLDRLPTVGELPKVEGSSPAVAALELLPGGVIRIRFKGHRAIEGKAAELVPLYEKTGQVDWKCRNIDVPVRELPATCRQP